MTEVSIEGGSGQVLVSSFIELLVGNVLHQPGNKVNPHPGAGGVQALDGVVTVKWIEEQESGLGVVSGGAECVQKDGQEHAEGSPNCLACFVSLSHHGLEVELVNTSLREEDCIIVDHHEHVMEWLVWSLILPVVKSTAA